MKVEDRWPERARARIFTQLEILGHMVATAERWEPHGPAARILSERIAQDMVDALREAEASEDLEDAKISDMEKLGAALTAARDMMRTRPEGWHARIVGRITDAGSLVITTGLVTSVSRGRR